MEQRSKYQLRRSWEPLNNALKEIAMWSGRLRGDMTAINCADWDGSPEQEIQAHRELLEAIKKRQIEANKLWQQVKTCFAQIEKAAGVQDVTKPKAN